MRAAIILSGGVSPDPARSRVPIFGELVQQLAERCEVHAFLLHAPGVEGPFALGAATVHPVGEPRFPRLRLAQLGARLAGRLAGLGRFEVFHGFADIPGLLAGAAARAQRARSMLSLIGGELTCLPEIGYGAQQTLRGRTRVGLALRLADEVTVSSEFMAQRVRGFGREPRLVALGLSRARLQRPAASAPPGPPWRLLYVGALCRVKDPFTLLRALARLLESGLDVTLTLVGADDLGGEVQRFAAALGLEGRAIFQPWLPHAELEQLYATSHLLLMASRDDAAPVVVLEAASAGLPTVGTAVGYVADWHPHRAVAVPVGDPEALARAVRELLHDEAGRRQLGQAARAWALEHDAASTAEAFLRLYSSMER